MLTRLDIGRVEWIHRGAQGGVGVDKRLAVRAHDREHPQVPFVLGRRILQGGQGRVSQHRLVDC